ncbi:hypothetical protein BpHYR1_048149 [Brachionus plicatilis]|uniref:Uncharacterized protein n=1 Tax=Brachionus plicatilis TaxID=10195 RepID=A0A3M7T088_BRAPC|nr:hypothetical protein BpHYR1_048149 [Brachionus plicatilis]
MIRNSAFIILLCVLYASAGLYQIQVTDDPCPYKIENNVDQLNLLDFNSANKPARDHIIIPTRTSIDPSTRTYYAFQNNILKILT